MRSVLVPVEESEALAAQLDVAFRVAETFGAHVDGIPATWSFVPFDGNAAPYPVVGVSTDLIATEQKERAERAEKAFREYVNRRGTAWSDTPGLSDRPTAGWLKRDASGDQAIAEEARLYDVTVLARPAPRSGPPRMSLLETVLFDSGRPILVAPPIPPSRMGEVVMIAWNGSTETARAIASAGPFLRRANRTIILSVEEGMVSGPNAREAEAALRRDGIAAEAIEVRRHEQTTGEAILKEAAAQGADLLVKGAYTQSRLRQMIFGGATSHILREANLPVLMSY